MAPCIELIGGGWNGAIAKTRELHLQRFLEPFAWTQIYIPELHLSDVASMLVLQGMLLQDLFPFDSLFRNRDGAHVIVGDGLHILIKRGDFIPYAAPPVLKDVWLGHLDKVPDNLTREELLAAFLKQVN